MPIRTHRGRAAVYRRFWGWPMRSPSHLVGTVVMVVAIVVAAGIVVPKLLGDGGADAAPAGPPSSRQARPGADPSTAAPSTSSTSQPMTTRLTAPLETPTSAAPSPQALDVAEKWAKAWVKHPDGITAKKWADGMSEYTTDEYLPVLRSVDPANVPASKVTGKPKARDSFSKSVEVEIDTDGPTLLITVVRTNAGWRVSEYDRVG